MKLLSILKEIQIRGVVTPQQVLELWDDLIEKNLENYEGTEICKDYSNYIMFKPSEEISDIEFLSKVSKQKLYQYYKELKKLQNN